MRATLSDQAIRKIADVVTSETLRDYHLHHQADDVRSDALLGIAKALQRHDPTGGLQLVDYCYLRARGEVLDGMRSRTPLTRAQYAASKAGVEPSPAHLAPVSLQGIAARVGLREWPVSDPHAEADLDQVLNDETAAAVVWRRLELLTTQQRFVLEGHYRHDRTLQDLAAQLGVSPSRVSQVLKAAHRVLAQAATGEPAAVPRQREGTP